LPLHRCVGVGIVGVVVVVIGVFVSVFVGVGVGDGDKKTFYDVDDSSPSWRRCRRPSGR
jgi:hypothetical protein